MTTALILTTYNRPHYLRRCLESLSRATPPTHYIIVDDCSTDSETIELINNFPATVKIAMRQNKGIKNSLQLGFKTAFDLGADLAINLDADAIVKPDFIERLTRLHVSWAGKCIVSGFNCNNPKNPVLFEAHDHVTRQHCNGINMCMNREQYETIVRPALLKSGNWDYDSTHKQPFAITKPSVVQHIGMRSSMGHVGADVACDFVQLSLPTVTLFGIDQHDPTGIKRAADICTRDIEFGAVKVITQHDYFRGREGYSRFMIERLNEFVDTEHVLTFHADGYVQNVDAWDNEFLNYDFGGATWWYKDNMNVGNGGFSLRSKRLLEICARLDLNGITPHPEDSFLARDLRPWLEKEHGIKFMPEELANRFSIEAYGVQDKHYCGSFGFHGTHVQGLPAPLRKMEPPVKSGATARRR